MNLPVLLVGSEWLPNKAGGLNRYFHGLCHAVARNSFPAAGIVTFLREGQIAPLPLRAMACEGASLLQRLRGVRREAMRTIHAGIALANPHFALYAWPWFRHVRTSPLIVNFHGPWAQEIAAETGGRLQLKVLTARFIERSVYRRASRCITLSQFFAAVLARDYDVPSARISVVPGGADLTAFLAAPSREEARERLGWPRSRPIVLSVRRLTRRMGLDLLVKAARDLNRAVPGVLVLIAGTGPAKTDLERLIETERVADTVRLIGFLPEEDLPLAYAAADVSVLPSVALEGFGLTIVESLAAGTPAVATPVGGMPEVLGPVEPGLLTEDTSPAALASKLTAVLTGRCSVPDPVTCREYAMRFDWSAVFPQILHVWREAGADV